MAVKLIMTDLDGTLFKNDHESISERNVNALKKAQENGIKICIATGRTKSLLFDALSCVPFADYIITSNGAVTYDAKTDKIIASQLLDAQKADIIFSFIESHSFSHEIYFDGKCFLNSRSADNYNFGNISAHYLKILKDKANVVPSLSEHIGQKGVEKISILHVPSDILETVKSEILSIGGICLTSSIPENLEITDTDANKGHALSVLCKIIGINESEVMAFGDSGNDCEMLKTAGYSFATANAWDYAKKAAKHVTLSNEDDGVAVEIEKYLEGIK